MDDVMIILRYSDGAVGLTGWGYFLVWVIIMALLFGGWRK